MKLLNSKLLFKSFCCAFVLTIMLTLIPFEASCQEIQQDVFRLHILANSDSEEDQSLKLKVRDEILKYTENFYKSSNSKEEAIKITAENLQSIANKAKEIVFENGYDYQVKARVADVYFNTRTYENVIMPSGTYKALQIEIGNAEGKNWWCVMYPSLCVGASANYQELKDNMNDNEYNLLTKEKTVYKFKIIEYFEKIKSFFL
ncbi:MAG: stage II sporulation protein R [Ruminococcus sp.]|nr:stage II sporulation protein R [Ruminococcus sp.]